MLQILYSPRAYLCIFLAISFFKIFFQLNPIFSLAFWLPEDTVVVEDAAVVLKDQEMTRTVGRVAERTVV